MTRGYDDTVHVRLGDARPDGRRAPAQFLWRGRLYLVREVLGHWRERQAWWSLDQARAVHSEGRSTAPPPATPRLAQVGADREVWRVEAAPGRSSHPGVYQLAGDAPGPTDGPGAARTWRLLQVQD